MPKRKQPMAPKDNTSHAKQNFRWTTEARVVMVALTMKQFTLPKILQVIEGSHRWPYTKWKDVLAEFRTYLQQQDKLHQVPETQKTNAALEELARAWTKKFLQDGNVEDKPPHTAGWMIRKREAHLSTIRAKLLAGWHESKEIGKGNGQQRMYSSLEDLETRCPEMKVLRETALPHGCGLKTTKALWNMLTRQFPGLGRFKAITKRFREGEAVQVCTISLNALLHTIVWDLIVWDLHCSAFSVQSLSVELVLRAEMRSNAVGPAACGIPPLPPRENGGGQNSKQFSSL